MQLTFGSVFGSKVNSDMTFVYGSSVTLIMTNILVLSLPVDRPHSYTLSVWLSSMEPGTGSGPNYVPPPMHYPGVSPALKEGPNDSVTWMLQ